MKPIFSILLIVPLVVVGAMAQAQQPEKVPRIGFLSATSPSAQNAFLDAFKQGLRDLGYVVGQNVALEIRAAEGKYDSLPDRAAELVRLKVDVIFAASAPAIKAAKQATSTIPIVFETLSDPVADGFVANLARPGGNLTGLAGLAPELSGKRLELLKEIVPGLARVAVLLNPDNPNARRLLKETEISAQALGMQLQVLQVRHPDELDKAFSAMTKARAGALTVIPDPTLQAERKKVADLSAKTRLPAIYGISGVAESGGLMVYAPSLPDLWRRAATYVDKILKGAKPADLPVEQPKKFEFIINLKAAKQIGLTIPPNV
ncbi:MAG TPA: ABC transporter substrate-binding protein, partial [Candidatus Saccharimonadales bacterium]|nr:ABC transporter substrate-binding protein [Candidatus Saccharimonadales bacterium]